MDVFLGNRKYSLESLAGINSETLKRIAKTKEIEQQRFGVKYKYVDVPNCKIMGVVFRLRFEFCNDSLNKVVFLREDGYAVGNPKKQFSNTEVLLADNLGKAKIQRFPQKRSYREYESYSIHHYKEERFDTDVVEMSIKYPNRKLSSLT